MASPSLRAGSPLGTNSATSDSTSFTVTLPTHDTGDTLVIVLLSDGIPSISCTGWTNIFAANAAGSQAKCIIFRKDVVAASNAETNPVFTSDGAQQYSAFAFAIPGDELLNVAAAGTNGSSTNPNPPSFAPSGGTQDYLWIAIAGTDNGSGNDFTDYPVDYTDGQFIANGVGTGVTLAVAMRQTTGNSQDPQSFAALLNEQWVAITAAIWATPPAPPPSTGNPARNLLGLI